MQIFGVLKNSFWQLSLIKKVLISAVVSLLLLIIALNIRYPHYSLRQIFFDITAYKISGTYKSLETIDKIYVLNLDRHTERWARMQEVLKSLDLPKEYMRYSAADGRKVKLENSINGESITGDKFLENNKHLSGKFNIYCPNSNLNDFYINLNQTQFSKRSIGEYGVYCSHREIWNDMLENGYKKVLILEDDVEFRSFSKEFLALSLQNLPQDADILYLGLFRQPDSLDLATKDKYYVKVLKNIASTEAYMITDKAARILLQNTREYYAPVDITMSDIIENHQLTAYAVYPIISRQVGESLISENK